MARLHKFYLEFMKKLNNQHISWCIIKDFDHLMKTGYDNEIDLAALGKDRTTIRRLGALLGWYESALNEYNTHLIFWRFELGIPYRIDVHLDNVLATAVPWFKAKDILNDRVKEHGLWKASPKWELGILLLSSLRGRKPKKHRIVQAKRLKEYVGDAKRLFSGRPEGEEIEVYYDHLVNGKVVSLSKMQRLGLAGIIREKLLLLNLFFSKLSNRSPIFTLQCTTSYDKRLLSLLKEKLDHSKLHVSVLQNPSFLDVFFKRITSDLVIIYRDNYGFSANPNKSFEKNTKEIIGLIYP